MYAKYIKAKQIAYYHQYAIRNSKITTECPGLGLTGIPEGEYEGVEVKKDYLDMHCELLTLNDFQKEYW